MNKNGMNIKIKEDSEKNDKNEPSLMNEIKEYLRNSEIENTLDENNNKQIKEEFIKMKSKNDEIKLMMSDLYRDGKIEEIFIRAVDILKTNYNLDKKIKEIKTKNTSLESEISEQNLNMIDKKIFLTKTEKANKLCLEKLRELNDEKKKIIEEEKTKYDKLFNKCEGYKLRVETFLPDLEILIEENKQLSSRLEVVKKESDTFKEYMKDSLEKKDLNKQKVEMEAWEEVDDEFEDIVKHLNNYKRENIELKKANDLFEKRFEEAKEPQYQLAHVIKRKKEDLEKLSNILINLEKINLESKAKNENKYKQLSSLNKENHDIADENSNLENEMFQLSNQIKSLNEKLNINNLKK